MQQGFIKCANLVQSMVQKMRMPEGGVKSPGQIASDLYAAGRYASLSANDSKEAKAKIEHIIMQNANSIFGPSASGLNIVHVGGVEEQTRGGNGSGAFQIRCNAIDWSGEGFVLSVIVSSHEQKDGTGSCRLYPVVSKMADFDGLFSAMCNSASASGAVPGQIFGDALAALEFFNHSQGGNLKSQVKSFIDLAFRHPDFYNLSIEAENSPDPMARKLKFTLAPKASDGEGEDTPLTLSLILSPGSSRILASTEFDVDAPDGGF